VPDFSTLSRRQKTLKVNIPYRGSDDPLHLLVDSTGIKAEGKGEWNARKHGGAKRPSPRFLEPVAKPWLDWRKCHDAIAARGAAAIIPPRKNAKPWKPDTAGAIARNEILQTSKRVGRTIWRRWSGYHRRSRAETKIHCVKLLGQRLSAREVDRQVAEFQVRVAVLNGFTALGTPITDGRGINLSGERGRPVSSRFVQQSRPSFITRALGVVPCLQILDHLKPEFPTLCTATPAWTAGSWILPALFTMTGWLRHRDNAGRSGRCIRSRCGA